MPKKGPMTKSDIFRLITELKISEMEKTACGLRIIEFYGTFVEGKEHGQ
jgi:hypothetical protein